MEKRFVLVLSLFLGCFGGISLWSQEISNPGLRSIINHYAPRNFASGEVPKADLDLIIRAGIRAPSAGNRQPWHFTVVQNPALARSVVPGIENGNVLIVVSASGDNRTNTREILDCALATQSIYLAAQALGYGSRIYTGPIDALNRSLKGDLGLPSGYSAVALVRVGRVQGALDAVSGASSRASVDSKVNYK
ncbi:MAG: nitroreductase family protein [Treponema sp.]|jgi:nitroreductase|nr:nitroreductase family protein [Treponema sp.]